METWLIGKYAQYCPAGSPVTSIVYLMLAVSPFTFPPVNVLVMLATVAQDWLAATLKLAKVQG
jgi:hypothetical protein